MSLYTELMQAGIKCDHWQSDLYVEDCPESRAILANHGLRVDGHHVIKMFGHENWLEIPFQYSPFWERAACTG